MNDIVKYHNDMNKVNLASFSTKELDLFFSICFKLKEMGTDEIKISFNDIKFLIGEENNPKRVKFYIDNLNKKLAQLNYQFEISPNVFERFVLFTNFTSNYNDNSLTIKVNSKFGYLLNNLIGNFTKFDLIEFVNLKSSYSKNMFKFLKQWESIKVKEFKIDEFRELLNIPKGFTISKIDERILKPIMDELPQYFSNLNLQKIKTGRSVTSLKFTWSGKVEKIASQKKVDVIDIIEISDKLNKVIEKVKQNRFIKPLLIIDNIEILVEMFQEKDLIKGLNWSYKEIKQEIKSLNYLIKSIKTGMEQKEKKLVVKTVPEIVQEQEIKEEILKENNLDLEKDQELKITEIEKVTKDEYEELYKKFLQEQNTEHNLLTRKGFDIANKNKYEIIENKKQK
ncbi:replication initiation protein, partial [Cetobacterium sp.]